MAAQIDPRQRRILIGLFSVVATVIWTQFFLIPQFSTAGRLGGELKKMRSQTDKAKRELSQLPELEKKIATLAAQHSMSIVEGSAEEQLPNLLDHIALAARTAQVRVISLKPKQEIVQAPMGPSGYIEIPLELVGTAGYHQIGRFLAAVEGSSGLVRVKQLEIRPNATDIWSHQVRILLLAFLNPAETAKSS